MNSPLSFSEYHLLFGLSIRANLNWDMLLSIDPKVTVEVVSTTAELSKIYTVWHQSADCSRWAAWDEEGAVPQTVEMAGNSNSLWGAEKKQKIEKLKAQYFASDEPLVMMVPAYRVGDGVIILDSTHRAVSAYLALAPVRLMLCIIEGPVDENILPDLRSHTKNTYQLI